MSLLNDQLMVTKNTMVWINLHIILNIVLRRLYHIKKHPMWARTLSLQVVLPKGVGVGRGCGQLEWQVEFKSPPGFHWECGLCNGIFMWKAASPRGRTGRAEQEPPPCGTSGPPDALHPKPWVRRSRAKWSKVEQRGVSSGLSLCDLGPSRES